LRSNEKLICFIDFVEFIGFIEFIGPVKFASLLLRKFNGL